MILRNNHGAMREPMCGTLARPTGISVWTYAGIAVMVWTAPIMAQPPAWSVAAQGAVHTIIAIPVAFFGTYIDVTPNARLAWTNEESADGAVTTVTFAEKAGKTLLTLHERYPTKEALDQSIEGMEGGMHEQF
jgi:uncharacterized protein YndB with AHSA1/START domain